MLCAIRYLCYARAETTGRIKIATLVHLFYYIIDAIFYLDCFIYFYFASFIKKNYNFLLKLLLFNLRAR